MTILGLYRDGDFAFNPPHSLIPNGDAMPDAWYAARAKPGQEHIALDCLARQSFIAYYPKITIERSRGGRIVRDSEGLFPGYVLVMFCMAIPSWRAINNTRGIVKLLGGNGDGSYPIPLPVREVERLQERERRGQLFISEVVRVRRGDKVRVKFGWAVDQIGTVMSTRKERVDLLISLLGRDVRLIAAQHAVELVRRPAIPRVGRAEALPAFIRRPLIRIS